MTAVDCEALRGLLAKATPGPWAWDVNRKHRQVSIKNERGYYVMEFARWGMQGGQPIFPHRTDGFVVTRKLSEMPNWSAPIPGQEHHASWHSRIAQPDALLMVAAVNALPALLDTLAAQAAEIEALRRFVQAAMEPWPMGDLDGGTLQDIAVKHGLLQPVVMKGPCSEECACTEYITADEWPSECYRRTTRLTGRIESDAAIAALQVQNHG